VAEPLRVARIQDAAAWLSLAIVLLLAPVAKAYDLLGLPQPDPAAVAIAAGAGLAAAGAALLRSRRRMAVLAAALADLAAAALLAWVVADDPATRTRGTIVLVLVALSLALQAGFDALMLQQAGPPVDAGSDRTSDP
jgi:hypothetical protein